MPLVEVVPGEKTDPKVVDITFDLMAKIGTKPAKIKKESLGFVGNRLQLAVLREAFYIVQQGIADAATVDDEVQSRPSLESGRPPRQHRPRRPQCVL